MSLPAGARLGPYEVLSPLGKGGMGEVYRAKDTRLDRTVALKILSASASEAPQRVERFRQEARAISRLSHPHICTLYDVGEQDGTFFLVMEHLQGRTLAQRLDEGPLIVDEVLRYGVEIAEALDAAHRAGVVHRDLKPANVMLTREGVKLLDFGVARLKAADEDEGPGSTESLHLTADGVAVGTVPYMAPEQLEGKAVDARTDIFALGTLLYEMASGQRPFAADSRPRLIAEILTSEPRPLASIQPLAPPALEWVVKRCLAKAPDERWQSARDVAAQLGWLRERGAAGDPATTAGGRPRHAGLAWAVAALGVLAAGAIALLAALGRIGTPPPPPRFERLTFRPGFAMSARFAPDGQTVVYSAAWQGEPLEMFLTRLGSAESRPLGLKQAQIAAISRGGEMAFLLGMTGDLFTTGTLARAPFAGGAPRPLLDNVRDADWTPDGAELAVIRRDGRRDVVEFPLGRKVHDAPYAWSLRVSPDGQSVAFVQGPFLRATSGCDLMVADRSGRVSLVRQLEAGPIGLAWSPRGDEVWFGANPTERQGGLRAVSLSGRQRILAGGTGAFLFQDVATDGRALVIRAAPRLGLACRASGEALERDLGWLDSSWVEDVSADGRAVLFSEGFAGGSTGGSVYVRGTDGSPAVRLGEGRGEALSPDGKWAFVIADRGKPEEEWMLLPTGAGTPRTLSKGPIRTLLEADWLADGRRIVLAGRDAAGTSRAYLLDVEDGRLQPLGSEGVSIPENAVTGDGRHFLGFAGDRAFLFSADGGEPRPVPHLAPADRPLQWSADGRWLFVRRAGSERAEIDRIEVATGARKPWLTLAPRDPVGGIRVQPVVLAPDGGSYCYSYFRALSDVFLVEGLR